MTAQGDPITAAMVLFCAVVAPVLLVVSISYLWLGNVLGMNLRPVLLMLGKLKEWVMLDIYLVGIGVASIKVQDYAFLQPGIGLVAFISLTLLSILTLIHMNVEELWERFYPSVRRPAPIIICRCAPAAITPAIATRAAAADAATRRCIIADRRACSAAGRR
ncbi:membrane protein [Klebsiella pneumoniae subsp. ozaenae]|uniref:Membrane protein n=1 Tax=Klebsiella pneumoniae subsp. ozaenae TaxID=574 RepID=A0A378BI10_KLEPO|nr:membrane protein [Klebsiella pneumoniae subsp. ozaenae]